jgi:hypothetical protein
MHDDVVGACLPTWTPLLVFFTNNTSRFPPTTHIHPRFAETQEPLDEKTDSGNNGCLAGLLIPCRNMETFLPDIPQTHTFIGNRKRIFKKLSAVQPVYIRHELPSSSGGRRLPSNHNTKHVPHR